MKSTLIRLLSIMTLATSMTAFAFPKNAKNSTNCSVETTSAPASQPASRDSQVTAPDTKQDNDEEKSRHMKIQQQEQQWLYDVQNTVAG